MSKYIVCCPNCGNKDIEEIDFPMFECSCGEEFSIEDANIEKEYRSAI